MDNMKFMDAGKESGFDSPTLPTKYYPKFTVDLSQFPGLQADMDECVELNLKGRVCSLTHNEYCHEMQVEVTSVAIPTHTKDSIGPMNEADKALGKMKSARRY